MILFVITHWWFLCYPFLSVHLLPFYSTFGSIVWTTFFIVLYSFTSSICFVSWILSSLILNPRPQAEQCNRQVNQLSLLTNWICQDWSILILPWLYMSLENQLLMSLKFGGNFRFHEHSITLGYMSFHDFQITFECSLIQI